MKEFFVSFMCIYSAVVEADTPEDAAEVAAADCPCDIDGEASLPSIASRAASGNTRPVTVLVGPEGGFSPREIELAKKYTAGKVELLKLGNTRLRGRTAAIVALGKIL